MIPGMMLSVRSAPISETFRGTVVGCSRVSSALILPYLTPIPISAPATSLKSLPLGTSKGCMSFARMYEHLLHSLSCTLAMQVRLVLKKDEILVIFDMGLQLWRLR